MSTRFERFSKMAKDEFGLNVVKKENVGMDTFESLFGISIDSISQYKVPYNIQVNQFGYYDDSGLKVGIKEFDLLEEKFETNNFDCLAA